MNEQKNDGAVGFASLGIAPSILKILDEIGYVAPTPIQKQSIPQSLTGNDIVGIAQTGTGKTLAFGIPMIERIARYKGRGLVVLPTRELALQVDENLRLVGAKLGLRTAVLIGGEVMGRQLKALAQKPHIIIATPGRLIDHAEGGSVDLSDVRVLVLDEADRMLDMGFMPQIKRILKLVPTERQTMLFSATMPDDIAEIAKEYMKMPVRVEVAPAGSSSENVEQELFVLEREGKLDALKTLLEENKGSVLVFMRTKHTVRSLTKKLQRSGYSAAEIHSNRSLAQRQEALSGFKSGKYRVLVATDIAARGIDVTGIELVVNYDLPEKADDYVHRIGRTGRAEMNGRAVSFVLPEQVGQVWEIERLISKKLKIDRSESELREMHRTAVKDEKDRKRERRGGRSDQSGRRERPARSERHERGDRNDRRERSDNRQATTENKTEERREGNRRGRRGGRGRNERNRNDRNRNGQNREQKTARTDLIDPILGSIDDIGKKRVPERREYERQGNQRGRGGRQNVAPVKKEKLFSKADLDRIENLLTGLEDILPAGSDPLAPIKRN